MSSESPLLGSFIGGAWAGPGAAEAASLNPARPQQVVGRHAVAGEDDVARAVEAARGAQREWWRAGPIARGAILRRAAEIIDGRAEELGRLMTREEGKTLPEAIGEARRAAQVLQYHAAQAWQPVGEVFASSAPDEEIRTHRVPIGVTAIITPWNFPLAIPAWKIAPALAYGNTVVWKSASNVPVMAVEFARVLVEAGVPDGVLNLVLGPGRIGDALVNSDVDAISFTGSTEIGRGIWAQATPRGVRVQMELGGHNAAIVFEDADLDLAARHVVDGAMLSTGQKCTATRRVVVHRLVHDALVEKVANLTRQLRVGDGLEGAQIGPLVSASARDEVSAAVEAAVGEGCEALVGGHALDGPELDGGYYFAPTVLVGVEPSKTIAQEEVFGPVLSVIEVADDEEALAVANSTRYGLSAAAFTSDERRIRRVLDEVNAGLVHINNPTPGAEPHVPFGGIMASSTQAPPEQGQTARDFFTELRTAYIRPGS